MSESSPERERGRPRIISLLPLLVIAAVAGFFAFRQELVPDLVVKQQTYPDETLPRPHRIDVGSPITGTRYEVYVQVPHGYTESVKHYPVFYVLPGRAGIAGHRQMVLPLLREGAVPEAIFVGIDQRRQATHAMIGRFLDGAVLSRTSDYTFAVEEGQDHASGGAVDFLAFLRDNIIPYIDATYRTLPGDRGIGGHSLEAQFVLFVAMTEPDLFQRYVVSSPPLHTTDFAILDLEESLAQHRQDLPIALYLSAGQLESQGYLHSWQVMTDTLQQRSFPGFRFKSEMHDERDHNSVVIDAAQNGLTFVYAPKS